MTSPILATGGIGRLGRLLVPRLQDDGSDTGCLLLVLT
jgi:hypothetical protein